jgi:hypothetical protein
MNEWSLTCVPFCRSLSLTSSITFVAMIKTSETPDISLKFFGKKEQKVRLRARSRGCLIGLDNRNCVTFQICRFARSELHGHWD